MNSISDKKNKLKGYINNVLLTYDNYDVFVNLYKNYDDRMFARIIEGLDNGSFHYSDFKQLIGNSEEIEKSIESQERIFRENKLMREHLEELEGLTGAALLTALQSYNFKQFINTDNEVVNAERENIISSVLEQKSANPMENAVRAKILTDLIDSNTGDITEVITSGLLSSHDYIVPVDYDHIILTKEDLIFASENGLSDEEMKKMKSLAAYLSNYY